MTDVLGAAGAIGGVVGSGMIAISLIAMIANVRDPAERTRALGFALAGASVVSLSAAVIVLSRLGDRLPFAAGAPVIAFLLVFGLILRLAASREFQRYRSYKSER